MNETLALMLAAMAGMALGAVFFGGLWWTVRKGIASEWPALWFMGSLLLRTTIVLVGFYLAGAGHWQRMVACLLGFLAGRFAIIPLTRKEASHESYL